ncbi:MAG: pyridoxal 5'-phosphate synthase glutaminase subunit PdxT [Chloroflexi bacterium]|nr:pyridoxal 5'-phosphate synthase glutaminase subunit PdxT [Chloroflexota bacterium]
MVTPAPATKPEWAGGRVGGRANLAPSRPRALADRPRIGVLAMQGDFAEHAESLRRAGAEPVEVRLPGDLEGLDGLIIPGGESTTIGKLLDQWGMIEPLREQIGRGLPVWGTCAGAILLAKDVRDALPGQPLLEVMDIAVRRNAFGRQVQSFEAALEVPALGDEPFPAVFIRAPRIEAAGPQTEVLAMLPDGTIAAVRQGHLLATAFHPELTPDVRFHQLFLEFMQAAARS